MYGYHIENGVVKICEEEATTIRQIYKNYLSGLSLECAAEAAGVRLGHSSVKRLLQNKHLLGDEIYPAIIDQETYSSVEEERKRRELSLGRDNRKKTASFDTPAPVRFKISSLDCAVDDPYQRAEYLYAKIEEEKSDINSENETAGTRVEV